MLQAMRISLCVLAHVSPMLYVVFQWREEAFIYEKEAFIYKNNVGHVIRYAPLFFCANSALVMPQHANIVGSMRVDG